MVISGVCCLGAKRSIGCAHGAPRQLGERITERAANVSFTRSHFGARSWEEQIGEQKTGPCARVGSAGRVLALVCALALTQSPVERVTVGAHLRNVEAINLEENSYFASFVMWVTWKGERDPTKGLRAS